MLVLYADDSFLFNQQLKSLLTSYFLQLSEEFRKIIRLIMMTLTTELFTFLGRVNSIFNLKYFVKLSFDFRKLMFGGKSKSLL